MSIFNKKGNAKVNIKVCIAFIIGLLISGISVYAATVINSTEVSYTSNGQSTVKGAIDDLYNKASGSYFNKRYIKAFNVEGETISTTDHANELRFIGANPPNYVRFNNQVWRIIGIFDGKLKLVSEPIGNYSFDTSKETVNRGLGVNAWEDADLMKLLNPGYESNSDLKCNTNSTYVSNNGDGYAIVNCGNNSSSAYTTGLVNNSLYWNAGSGKCYNYGNYQVTDCNFSSTGLSDNTSKSMIDDNVWYLGSNNKNDDLWGSGQIMTASYLYEKERGSLLGKQCSNNYYCSDSVTRLDPPRWTGKVGLLYPSDYAYATSGSTSGTDRATCLSKQVGYVSNSNTPSWVNTYADCKNNDWLLNTSMWTWSLSPRLYSDYSTFVFDVNTAGYVGNDSAIDAGTVRPVVYLKSGVTITKGDGTQSNPFVLSMN